MTSDSNDIDWLVLTAENAGDAELDFVYLRDSNYKVKFRQKLILVISGLIFWICLALLGYKHDLDKRIQEINNADIHKWEENRIK